MYEHVPVAAITGRLVLTYNLSLDITYVQAGLC